jgi:ABC-type bacteriocin/lantibiotic exporter with double-glycine peptidase domain
MAMLGSVAHACFIVVLIAFLAPHVLLIALVVGVLYVGSIPFVLRLVERDFERRTTGEDAPASDAFGRER